MHISDRIPCWRRAFNSTGSRVVDQRGPEGYVHAPLMTPGGEVAYKRRSLDGGLVPVKDRSPVKSKMIGALEGRGGVLTNNAGLHLMRGEVKPARCLVVVEGELDLWTLCGLDIGWPAWGVVTGSQAEWWSDVVAHDAVVYLLVDLDEGGDGHAKRTAEALPGRSFRRLRRDVAEGRDINAMHLAGVEVRDLEALTSTWSPPAPPQARLPIPETLRVDTGAIPDEMMEDALITIPADLPRHQWVRVLGALKAWSLNGGGDGESMGRRWSSLAGDGYCGDKAFRAEWRGLSGSKGTGPATVLHIAKEHGWKHPGRPTTTSAPARITREQMGSDELDPTTSEGWAQLKAEHWSADEARGWPGGIGAPSHTDLAERLEFVLRMKREGRGGRPVVACERQLWAYEPPTGRWVALTTAAIYRIMRRWNGSLTTNLDNKPTRVALQLRDYRGAIDVLMTLLERPDHFDGAPLGVAVGRTFLRVDLDQADVIAERVSPKHRIRWSLDCEWRPDARGQLLDHYLGTTHGTGADETRLAMSQVAFAALTGTGPHWSKAALLVGTEGTGKSQFLDMLAGLVPAGARCSVAPSQMSQEYYLARLAGKALNTVAELPKRDIVSESGFKSIVTGDEMTGRKPGGEPFSFRPRATHVFSANRIPHAPGATSAFFVRWLIISFEQHFRHTAGDIKGIGARIAREELEALVAWAVGGGRELLRSGGYATPGGEAKLRAEWNLDSCSVSLWRSEETTDVEPGVAVSSWLKVISLFRAYQAWAIAAGVRHPVGRRTFASRLVEQGVRRETSSSVRLGLTLLEEPGAFG